MKNMIEKIPISKEMLNAILGFASVKIEIDFRDGTCKQISPKLTADNVEIEGFERVEWVKFDPNDPKTFPPCGEFLGYVAGTVVRAFRHPGETDEYFANKFSIKNHLTHWRPLPKPPPETEVENE